MPRRKSFSLTREVFKITKAANRLRKAVDAHTELMEGTSKRSNGRSAALRLSSSADTKPLTQEDAAYENKVLRKLGGSVEKYFYNKLVGVSFRNADESSRKEAIQALDESEELDLHREPDNKYDPNAILVRNRNGTGIGYLNKRLAGEVTRSMNRGVKWNCYVRKILHASGTQNWGVTVFMVKRTNAANSTDFSAGLSGTEFLAKHYPDYKGKPQRPERSAKHGGSVIAFLLFVALLVLIIHGC